MGTRIREISLFSPNFFSFLFSIRKLKKMKLEISLIFAMSIFAAVEGAPHNSPDKEYDARISSTYYQALKTKLADIEAGVRIVDEQGGSSQPAAGRLEVFQEGEWQKICMIKNDFNAQVNAVNVICKMKLGSARAYGSTHSSHYFNQKTEDSGVSKHVFLCD